MVSSKIGKFFLLIIGLSFLLFFFFFFFSYGLTTIPSSSKSGIIIKHEEMIEDSFGKEEYECFGTCSCIENENERRAASAIISPKSVSLLIFGLTSFLVMKEARKYFEERTCQDVFFDEPCHAEIVAEIDECLPIGGVESRSRSREEQEFFESEEAELKKLKKEADNLLDKYSVKKKKKKKEEKNKTNFKKKKSDNKRGGGSSSSRNDRFNKNKKDSTSSSSSYEKKNDNSSRYKKKDSKYENNRFKKRDGSSSSSSSKPKTYDRFKKKDSSSKPKTYDRFKKKDGSSNTYDRFKKKKDGYSSSSSSSKKPYDRYKKKDSSSSSSSKPKTYDRYKNKDSKSPKTYDRYKKRDGSSSSSSKTKTYDRYNNKKDISKSTPTAAGGAKVVQDLGSKTKTKTKKKKYKVKKDDLETTTTKIISSKVKVGDQEYQETMKRKETKMSFSCSGNCLSKTRFSSDLEKIKAKEFNCEDLKLNNVISTWYSKKEGSFLNERVIRGKAMEDFNGKMAPFCKEGSKVWFRISEKDKKKKSLNACSAKALEGGINPSIICKRVQ